MKSVALFAVLIAAYVPSLMASVPLLEEKVQSDNIDAICVRGGDIFSGSFDGTIKKIDPSGNISLIGKHDDWVRGLVCRKNEIISVSNDGTLSIWYTKPGSLHKTYKIHDWWISDVKVTNNTVVTVSLDRKIKVFDYPSMKLRFEGSPNHQDKHYTVAIGDHKAFIGSSLGRFSVLDLNNFQWLVKKQVIAGSELFLSSTSSQTFIYLGSSDGIIYKIDSSNEWVLQQVKLSNFAIKALKWSDGKLYTGSDDGEIRIVDAESLKILGSVNKSKQAVRALDVANGKLYAGYDEGYVRVFKLDPH